MRTAYIHAAVGRTKCQVGGVRAKIEAREQARALRRQGKTYDEIVSALGVSKSSVSLWVRDLPKPPPGPEHTRMMAEARWGPYRRKRDISRQRTKLAAAQEVGRMTDRELFLVGVGLYWAEGTKAKPPRRCERVTFINSDPDMITLYLAWLDLLGVERGRLRFAVSIHESADVPAAESSWADHVGATRDMFNKTSLKKHNPRTVRKNVGAGYRGCLVVSVRNGADLYRRIEGWWYGIVVASAKRDELKQPS
jgi:transcriptional regulator with XRE-family HTH domain